MNKNTDVLWKSGYDFTISLILSAAAVSLGCIAGNFLIRVENAQIARRGDRAFRRIMAGREREGMDGK